MAQMIWHYTVDINFISIMEDCLIRPATLYVTPDEKPIVWFSAEQVWEPTVVKAFESEDGKRTLLGMRGLLKHGLPLFRIGVAKETAPLRWPDLKAQSGMTSAMGKKLEKTGRQLGADPINWRGTFDAVPIASWLAVESYSKKTGWTSLGLDED